jgi:hypothetical protein
MIKMNNKDTYKIICSFLTPIELVISRQLSHYHRNWTDEYILKIYKKIDIEEYACPKCGNLISQDDISNYTDFNDYFLLDDLKNERFQKIKEWFNNQYIFNFSRKNLLCDSCEIEEDYSDYSLCNFRYKNKREYSIVCYFGLYSWSKLCLIDSFKNGFWNEYRKVIVSYTSYNTFDNMYDTYDEEEDENDEIS